MADTTITSANSVFTIVASIFPSPQQLKGYSSDKAVITDAIETAEIQMGVDGRMTGGFVFMPTIQTITLQADSPSRVLFTTIAQYEKTVRDKIYLTGRLSLPSTGEKYALTKGLITNLKQIPDLMKVLAPVDIKITWESVNLSPI